MRRRLPSQWVYYVSISTVAAIIALCLYSADENQRLGLSAALTLTLFCLAISINGTKQFSAYERRRRSSERKSAEGQRQMRELFAMTELLQSADSYPTAGAVVEATAKLLLPTAWGSLQIFNNSKDRLDLITAWNLDEDQSIPEVILGSSCWALKRGRPHTNGLVGRVSCFHAISGKHVIEAPMQAKGQIYGLLSIGFNTEQRPEELADISNVANALADSLSLSLSNISLNEQLRSQSMRDPLTGLYNRRYLIDAIERSIAQTARTSEPTSGIMIDLDHFKRLNDEHGHPKGDAVLRDVASSLVGSLRPSDTVSRMGGEELFVLLPQTSLSDATTKAEALRVGIERLSEVHETPISASFGVAEIPHCASDGTGLIERADAALYEAKSAGRNCVRVSDSDGVPVQWFEPQLVN